MIQTLALTLILESGVIFAYAQLRKKPLIPLLLTGVSVNLFTQSFLWGALIALPAYYLMTLFTVEIVIVGIESLAFYWIRQNRLSWREALILGLLMNLVSFSTGWFLRA